MTNRLRADTNEQNLTVSNTESTAHTYTIDWTPDSLSWLIDGKVMRTKNRNETWNATSNRYDYPQTPARVMLSLWPAGLQSNGEGTIQWAGGLIDWNSPYMQNGYYYAMFSDVNVQCYNPPSTAGPVSGSKAYQYTDSAGTNDTVATTNNLVILKSLQSTGDDNVGPDPSSSSAGSKATAAPESVPGVSGAGTRGDTPDGSGSGGSSASSAAAVPTAASTGFSQGTGSSGKSLATREQSSFFAVLVAVGVALCWCR
jgi:hypothetical protein